MINQHFAGTYAPRAVTAILTWTHSGGGMHVVRGGTSDTDFITIAQADRSVTRRRGVNESMLVVWANTDADVTVTIQQTSVTNDVFTQLHKKMVELAETGRGRAGLFSLMIVDNSGRSKFYAAQCMIGQIPDQMYNTEGSDISWTLECINATTHVGGGDTIDSTMRDTLISLGYEPNLVWTE